MKRELGAFTRRYLQSPFEARGFRRTAPTRYERGDKPGVVSLIGFSTERTTRRFTPRLYIVLEPFYDREEIGVTLFEDLTSLVPGRDGADWWTLSQASEGDLAQEISSLMQHHGFPWLDRYSEIKNLMSWLEEDRHLPEAEAHGGAVALLQAHGFQVAKASASGEMPRLRPSSTKHLSYCHQLEGNWSEALRVWDEYCAVYPGGEGSEVRKGNQERREYLAARALEESTSCKEPMAEQ